MKRYLVVTIDVEPDSSAKWQYSNPLSFTGVTDGIGKKLQPLFEEHNVVPTYLINNVVLEDKESVSFFNQMDGQFELGTHLHPEFIEPEKEFYDYAGKSGRANCCFYAPAIEREKIKNITTLFENSFGYKPTVFRAGRYSAGPNTIQSLADLGYKIDTSVSPHICWNDNTRKHPVDFTHAFEQPYFIKEGSILQEDKKGRVLEVPISIGLTKRNRAIEFLSSMSGLRHPIRQHKSVWLRPYYSSVRQMKHLVNSFSQSYQQKEIIVFNMMFHNVEVMPGLNPYTSTETQCKRYLHQLRQFFSFCNDNDIQGICLSDLYDAFRE